jgi:hypothetical protein
MSEEEKTTSLEEKYNEKLIEVDDLKSKISKLEIDYDLLKSEYTWLSRNYSGVIALIYDQLDEIAYKVKHSNLSELLQSREEEKKTTEQKPNS